MHEFTFTVNVYIVNTLVTSLAHELFVLVSSVPILNQESGCECACPASAWVPALCVFALHAAL